MKLQEIINQKDHEIQRLSEQIINAQLDVKSSPSHLKAKRPTVPGTLLPGSSPANLKAYIPAGYSGVTMLEEKLRLAEAQNAALQEEVRLLKRVQDQQGKALETLNSETDYPQKINTILEDLRVQKEHNRVLKSKVYEAEKASRNSHDNMIKQEQTIRELKKALDDTKRFNAKSKQNAKLEEAADKIDELVEANQYLNAAKDQAVQLSSKQRQQFQRQIAQLQHRNDFLT